MADGWTVDEAVEELDPPIEPRRLRDLLAGVRPVGTRFGARGRRPKVYPVTVIAERHAAWVREHYANA